MHRILFFLLFAFLPLGANEGHYSLDASLVGMRMDYREYDDNSVIQDSEKSDFSQMIGMDLGFSYLESLDANDFSMVDISLLHVSGKTQYLGSILGSNDPYGSTEGTTLNNITNVDVAYLYGRSLGEQLHFLFGGVLGHRVWKRTLSKVQVETYSWYYIEPKAGVGYKSNAFRFKTFLGYKYAINPEMRATGIHDTFKLGSVKSFNVSAKLAYEIVENIELFGEYVYENQEIKKSNVVYDGAGDGYIEPDSSSNDNYLKFGAAFKY